MLKHIYGSFCAQYKQYDLSVTEYISNVDTNLEAMHAQNSKSKSKLQVLHWGRFILHSFYNLYVKAGFELYYMKPWLVI